MIYIKLPAVKFFLYDLDDEGAGDDESIEYVKFPESILHFTKYMIWFHMITPTTLTSQRA